MNNSGDVRPSKETLVNISPANSGLRKTSSGEAAQVGVQQVSSKPTRSRPRNSSGISTGHPTTAWGPARFKLDNRTTTFRVLPPLPASISDVSFIFSFHLFKKGRIISGCCYGFCLVC